MIYSLLSHSWSGLLVAGAVAVVAVLIIRLAPAVGRGWVRIAGFVILALAVLMVVGGVRGLRRIAGVYARFSAPGKLVDVGGYRMHILAEGDSRGGPTVIWMPGSHDAGIGLFHLHKAIRQDMRSILFDRPGSGWSDPGPFPRSTAREATEMATLLDRAGEKGPFILVGHSYGGLLAANFARRYPERVLALVVADGTPPDVFQYLPSGHGPDIPEGIVKGTRTLAVLRMFGLGPEPGPQEPPPGDTAIARSLKASDDQLADVIDAYRAFSLVPDWATVSVFEEWRDPRLVADLVVYDNELGDLPVFVVTPAGKPAPIEARAIGVREDEIARAQNFLEQARMRYVRISRRAELIHTAPGTTHLYPFETPDVLLDLVRRIRADTTLRSAATAQTTPPGAKDTAR